jgi:hypothetical protein
MGGFELAGKSYVFYSTSNSLCMCYGVYGFINEFDEHELFTNKTRNVCDVMDHLSAELQKCLQELFSSHKNSNTVYIIRKREDFTIPSYWNPHKTIQM